MLSDIPYSAYGYAESPVSALGIGRAVFDGLMADDAEFRAAVFHAFSHRLMEMASVIDDLLLNHMDQKLAQWLVKAAERMPRIVVTHQMIAGELGSAREVMSRILKDFERRGWIELERGAVTVKDARRLGQHAASTSV